MQPSSAPNYVNGLDINPATNPTAGVLAQLNPNSDFSGVVNSARGVVAQPQQGSNQPSQMSMQPQQEKGNWFTHLIPTITSIGGGILGTLADPFTAGMGTFIGGAGGSALGKSLQNALEGTSTTGEDLLGAAGEGLLGAGVGKALQGGAGLIGGALAKTGEKGIAQAGAQTAADQAVADAQAIRNTYGGIKPIYAQKNDLASTLENAKSLGVNHLNPQELTSTAQNANDIVNGVLNKALTDNGTYNASGLNDLFKTAIGNKANTIGGVDAVALSKGKMGLPNTPGAQLYKQLQDLSAGVANNPNVDPTEVRSLISNIGSAMADAKPTLGANGVIDPIEKAKYNVLQDIYGQLKDSLYNRPGIAESVAAAKGGLQAGDVGGNELLANHLNDVIDTASDPQHLIDSLASFTKMSNIGNAASDLAKNPASAAALNAAKQEAGMGTGVTLDAQGNPVADIMAGMNHPVPKGLGKIMQLANNGGIGSQTMVNLGSTLSRMAPLTKVEQAAAKAAGTPAAAGISAGKGTLAGLPIAAGEIIGNSPSIAPGAMPAGSFNTGNQPTNGAPTSMQQGESPTQQAMKMALIGMQNPYNAASYIPLLSQLTGQAQQAHTAAATLKSLEDSYAGAGGGQGMVGGLLSKIGGSVTGNNVAAYDAQRQQAMQVLAKLGIPLSAIPDVTSTNQAAQGQFGNAQNIINSLYGGQ